jgi:hypothetical protein
MGLPGFPAGYTRVYLQVNGVLDSNSKVAVSATALLFLSSRQKTLSEDFLDYPPGWYYFAIFLLLLWLKGPRFEFDSRCFEVKLNGVFCPGW